VSVNTHLAEIRQSRGLSAAELAGKSGITRQTIYAIEAGAYVPNTAAALRLARVLGVTVEALFHLPEEAPVAPAAIEIDLVSEDDAARDGQPVQLGRVGSRAVGVVRSPLLWELPPADAFLLGAVTRNRRTSVRPFRPIGLLRNRVVVAGCDPGMSVLARHALKSGVELVQVHANSSRALAMLKSGLIHVAGSHLRDEATGESNVSAVKKQFPRSSAVVVNLATWEQGIVVAKRNPNSIRGVEDLARTDVRFINREPGAGSRALLDANLARLGIHRKQVKGYETVAHGHLPAAWQVRLGNADACIATRAAARVLGLDFLPLVHERYDLVLRKPFLAMPAVEALLETLSRADFRRELDVLGDYDTHDAGKVMH
jgi:molybdate-binding protein/DNA-binding XRE family transcriptional regulator